MIILKWFLVGMVVMGAVISDTIARSKGTKR
jgi:hypothetical protein